MESINIAEKIQEVIGRPWSAKWFCWTLVCHFQQIYGRRLPSVSEKLARDNKAIENTFAEHPERSNWVLTSTPSDGDIVLMARNNGGSGKESHSGVYVVLDKPYVLHVDQAHGTVLDTIPDVHSRRWHHLNFYHPRV